MKRLVAYYGALILMSLMTTASADVIQSGQPSTIPTNPGGKPGGPVTPSTVTPGASTVPGNAGGSPGASPAYTPPTGAPAGTNGTATPLAPGT
jgi:hypothetical protein